jgi:LmbE family N-acetylglucosaminyl deacetylase
MAKHTAAGDEVRVVFLAEGITARFDPKEFDRDDVVEASKNRNQNALKALKVLGVPEDSVYLNERYCCRLDQVPIIDLVKEIERHIAEFQPTRLFTHAAYDANVDHGRAHQAMITAIRPIGRDFLKLVMTFEVLSSTEWNPAAPFQPNYFTDITDYMDLKLEALAAYGDEFRSAPHPRSKEVLSGLARYRGAQIGVMFAEGFNLIRAKD